MAHDAHALYESCASRKAPRLAGLWVLSMLLSKFILAVARRLWYPYVTAVAERFGRSVESMSRALALVPLVYTLSPITSAPLGKWLSPWQLMALSLLLCALALVGLSLSEGFLVFVICTCVIGICKGWLDPACLFATRTLFSPDKRSKTTPVIELSFGMCSLVGIPLTGLLLAASWRLTFLVLAGVAALCSVLAGAVTKALMMDRASTSSQSVSEDRAEDSAEWLPEAAPPPTFWQSCKLLWMSPTAIGLLVSILGYGLVLDSLFIIFGIYYEEEQGLELSEIALVTFAVGAAETAAEVAIIFLIKRFGVIKCTLYTHVFCMLNFVLLPLLGQIRVSLAGTQVLGSQGSSLAAFFLCFFGEELSLIALLSGSGMVEVDGGIVEGAVFTGQGVGRTLGTLLGPVLWKYGKLWALGVLGATLHIVSLWLCVRGYWSSQQLEQNREEDNATDCDNLEVFLELPIAGLMQGVTARAFNELDTYAT